jgi:hypothetical protein
MDLSKQEYKRQWYLKNKDRLNEKNREYYEKNKEKINQQSKEYQKQYKILNKEKINQQSKEYYEKNKEKINDKKRKKRKENLQKIREMEALYRNRDRKKYRENSKKYYEKNKLKIQEQIKIDRKSWSNSKRQAVRENVKKYRESHPDIIKESAKKHRLKIHVKIVNNLRNRVRLALKHNGKSNNTMKLIGCTVVELKQHLQLKFKDGMSWENYGLRGWHIDHIIPCAAFDLSIEEEQKKCFNYTNLQPLWWHENLSKSDKILQDNPYKIDDNNYKNKRR